MWRLATLPRPVETTAPYGPPRLMHGRYNCCTCNGSTGPPTRKTAAVPTMAMGPVPPSAKYGSPLPYPSCRHATVASAAPNAARGQLDEELGAGGG